MNLHVVGANLVVSIKSFYREKTVVFFRIAFPVILILVFGTIFMERDNEIFDLDVQDLDQTKSSAQLVKAIGLSGRFKITQVAPAVNAAQYAKDNKRNLVLIIPKGFEESLMHRMGLDDPNAFVTLTEIHDPSSFGVTTKMQVLNMVLAGINQKMSGKPPFIKSAETSILTKKYRFIEFFVPGIIAMAVMTVEPVRCGERECGTPAEGRHQEAVHHPHHPYRLDPVERPVPVHPRGSVHDCDVAGELRRVQGQP